MILGLGAVLAGTVQISLQNKAIFLLIATALFTFVVYRRKSDLFNRPGKKISNLIWLVLLGNAFGFLLNVIFLASDVASRLEKNVSFGGFEKYSSFNEQAYGFVGGLTFIFLIERDCLAYLLHYQIFRFL